MEFLTVASKLDDALEDVSFSLLGEHRRRTLFGLICLQYHRPLPLRLSPPLDPPLVPCLKLFPLIHAAHLALLLFHESFVVMSFLRFPRRCRCHQFSSKTLSIFSFFRPQFQFPTLSSYRPRALLPPVILLSFIPRCYTSCLLLRYSSCPPRRRPSRRE